MSRTQISRPILIAFLVLIESTFLSSVARAEFATGVMSYTSGTLIAPSLNNPASALGMPAADTGFGVLTPFNPAFDPAHIVEIGPGGNLVLQLGAPAPTGAGRTIGVHAAVGLIDTDFPNGNPGPTAALFTTPRSATVQVSDDSIRWHSLGSITFESPTNYYSQGVTTPAFQTTPGTAVADFAKPSVHSLSEYNGLTWPGILTLLDNSAGGDWLDLTAVPYPNVNFVRFDVATGQRMILDAVAVVPEPAASGFCAVIALSWRRRRS